MSNDLHYESIGGCHSIPVAGSGRRSSCEVVNVESGSPDSILSIEGMTKSAEKDTLVSDVLRSTSDWRVVPDELLPEGWSNDWLDMWPYVALWKGQPGDYCDSLRQVYHLPGRAKPVMHRQFATIFEIDAFLFCLDHETDQLTNFVGYTDFDDFLVKFREGRIEEVPAHGDSFCRDEDSASATSRWMIDTEIVDDWLAETPAKEMGNGDSVLLRCRPIAEQAAQRLMVELPRS